MIGAGKPHTSDQKAIWKVLLMRRKDALEEKKRMKW